jgi:preprotein translocase subunit YajC
MAGALLTLVPIAAAIVFFGMIAIRPKLEAMDERKQAAILWGVSVVVVVGIGGLLWKIHSAYQGANY